MVEIYEMEVFLAAAETGSFSEAGRRMRLSQPAISMQIRGLEQRLGVELFHRAGRHIQLTTIGQALVPLARDLINHAAQVQETVTAIHGEVTGVLKIACGTTAGKYLLPRILAPWLKKYPAVQVHCVVIERKTVLEMIGSGAAHLGLTSACEPARAVEYQPFTADPIALIVPPGHPWSVREAIRIADLPGGKFVRRELAAGTLATVAEALSPHGLSLNDLPAIIVIEDSAAVYQAVAEGIGVAFISRWAAAQGIAAGAVIEVPITGLELVQPLYLVRPVPARPATVAAIFWDFVFSPTGREILGC
ncbi:MAG TPA: LysR family transcriptional regulator [Phototrophicaceae bacterium]|nr:LysR family transcriptional regulator [Phototrophicaceae bacterium]